MKKQTIFEWFRNKCAYIGWKLFIWGINMTQDEYRHQVYLQEREHYIADRRVGNSTRIIDNLIQDFFKKGKCVVYDHHPTRNATMLVYDKVLSRLKNEHYLSSESIKTRKGDFTIINLKHELHNN